MIDSDLQNAPLLTTLMTVRIFQKYVFWFVRVASHFLPHQCVPEVPEERSTMTITFTVGSFCYAHDEAAAEKNGTRVADELVPLRVEDRT